MSVILENIKVAYYLNESENFSFKKALLSGKLLPEKKTIFKNFSLEVSENSILGIEGSNGIGKTTLLSVIAGLIPVTSGSVYVKGKVLPLLGLGHVFHPDLDLYNNIKLWDLSFDSGFNFKKSFVSDILESAGLNISHKTILRSLSSGMKSRLSFELAMRGNEDILLLDEVFAVGDKEFREIAKNKMKAKFKNLKCAIIVSHDEKTLFENCNRIIRIKDSSSVEELK